MRTFLILLIIASSFGCYNKEQLATPNTIETDSSLAKHDKEFDNGSSVVISNLDESTITNLTLLGKVWGFLKYHHPEITRGSFNWDYELFRFLPAFLIVKNEKKRDQLIINWIDDLGRLENNVNAIPVADTAFIKPDTKWLDNLSIKLKNKLISVYESRSQEEQYYIKKAPNIGNPVFDNENEYSKMHYPDVGFRILSLYRYWNMICYFFPYKHLTDKSWNDILKEYLPIFINAKNELEYKLAALQLIGEIHDSHASLGENGDKIYKWKGEFYPPIEVSFIENKLIVTDYYKPVLKEELGLDIGDIITRINGKSIAKIVKEKSKYYPASNEAGRLRRMSNDLLRSNIASIDISYIGKSGKENIRKLYLDTKYSPKYQYNYHKSQNQESKSYKILDGNIGYIKLNTIKTEEIPIIKEELRDTKGMIIDIRNYPSAFVVYTLGSYFNSSTTPFVKINSGSTHNPGEFTFKVTLDIGENQNNYGKKLIVLVNENTQSQAEFTAMALRAGDNTLIIGSNTSGADGNISKISLPGDLNTRISGLGIYYPDGTETQRIGIVPDIKVLPSIAGIKEGRDELIEKAIELIIEN